MTYPDLTGEPLKSLHWAHASTLDANDYNPNTVFNAELKLLERSILLTRWIQPVLIRKADLTIIDGFHRTMLSRDSDALKEKYKGYVPVVELDVTRPQAMILTIRMNRAKGTHVAVAMSLIVRELCDVHHYDPQEVGTEMGMGKDEVELLRQDGVFKMKNISEYRYSHAWYPRETRA